MKKIKIIAGLLMLSLTACIETEIIPEILEPTVEISPKSLSLTVGQSATLTAMYTDEQGEDQSNLLEWRSNTPQIATVKTGGIVEALAVGQAWIVVSAPGGVADSSLITVVSDPNAVAAVQIIAPQNTLLVGSTLQCAAKAFNSANVELQGKTVSWRSSNTAVLSINANGLASANAVGNAQIIATVEGINSVPFQIEVTAAQSTSRSGNFQGNMSYTVSGVATLQQEGEALKLAFNSAFKSASGPGLRVYLAKNAPAVLTTSNSVKLGNLKSTSGAQTYDVPAAVKIDDFDFAVIYCEPFNVPFGFAKLN